MNSNVLKCLKKCAAQKLLKNSDLLQRWDLEIGVEPVVTKHRWSIVCDIYI